MIKTFSKNDTDKHVIILEDFSFNAWMSVEEPTKEELEVLVQEQSLDPWILEDALDMQEIPRVEVEKDIVYIFLDFVSEGEESIETVPMLFILKESGLITVSSKPFSRITKFMEEKIDFNTEKRVELLMLIFEEINDTYTHYLNSISKKIKGLSVKVDKIKNKDIIQFVYFENVLYDFSASLVRMNTIYTALAAGKVIPFTNGEKYKMDDIVNDTTQLVEITKENARMIVNIREAYSTIMTNNLNRVIKLFTSLTVILTIPTIVGSFFGMNVKLPYASNPLVFQDLVVGTAALCLLAIGIFYYMDWL